MGDVDRRQVETARRFGGRTLCALRLDAVDGDAAAPLKDQALALGVDVLDGAPGSEAASPRILVGDHETLRRLGVALETGGKKALGSAIRTALAAYACETFVLAFADGGRMDLSEETRVMGILNVTPDSFSDGASILSPGMAVDTAARMAEDGADMVDVGGESTRPGAAVVSADDEARRVVPAIRAIKRELGLRVSVDTMKADVARLAIEAGADVVNDVSAFSDPGMIALLRQSRSPVIVMHMRGTPRTMQHDTAYVDLLSSVVGFLRKSVERAVAAGLADDKILVDPGLGFGKSADGNLRILRELATLRSVGRPIVVGASRKSFIGSVLDVGLDERLEGSLAVAAYAAWRGAHVIRAHDVAATKRATRMIDAIRRT